MVLSGVIHRMNHLEREYLKKEIESCEENIGFYQGEILRMRGRLDNLRGIL